MKGKMHHAHHAHGGHAHHMVKKHSMHSMKHRSHHAKGGKVSEGEVAHDDTPTDVYAGGQSHVVKEAKGRKHGGRTKHVEAHGHMAHHRLDRPKRKHGGRTGSEMNPFSAAHNVKTPAGRDVEAGES